jgi:hypothetical protein
LIERQQVALQQVQQQLREAQQQPQPLPSEVKQAQQRFKPIRKRRSSKWPPASPRRRPI